MSSGHGHAAAPKKAATTKKKDAHQGMNPNHVRIAIAAILVACAIMYAEGAPLIALAYGVILIGLTVWHVRQGDNEVARRLLYVAVTVGAGFAFLYGWRKALDNGSDGDYYNLSDPTSPGAKQLYLTVAVKLIGFIAAGMLLSSLEPAWKSMMWASSVLAAVIAFTVYFPGHFRDPATDAANVVHGLNPEHLPHDTAGVVNIANNELSVGKIPKAIGHYDVALGRTPTSSLEWPRTQYEKARALEAAGDMVHAQAAYKAAIEWYAKHPGYYDDEVQTRAPFNGSLVLYHLGDVAGAAAWCQAAYDRLELLATKGSPVPADNDIDEDGTPDKDGTFVTQARKRLTYYQAHL